VTCPKRRPDRKELDIAWRAAGGDDGAVNWTYFHPWVLSLGVAAIATAVNAVVAVPLSYVLARHRFGLRWLVESVVIMPLILPPTVVGFALMFVIGRSGLWGMVTGHTLLFTRLAAVLASSVVSFPLLVLPVRAAFAAIPREYHEEARIAGLSAWQRFIHVALPLARGGILSGLLLGFARALGEFGATLMLVGTGEKTRTLPIQIYYDAGQPGDYSAAWPAVVALAVTSMGVILVANRLRWLDSEK
jgi:molybdate transport system permease protein